MKSTTWQTVFHVTCWTCSLSFLVARAESYFSSGRLIGNWIWLAIVSACIHSPLLHHKKTTQVVKKISPALTVRTWWFVHLDILYMLWFSFILGLHFIFLCFKLIIIHYHTPKQRKIKFKPRMKLNHNIYIKRREKKNTQSKRVSAFLPEWPMFLHRKSLLFEWESVEWIFIFHVLCDRFKRFFFCWNNNKNRGDNIP